MSAESASASVSLKKIVDWDGSSQDIHQALITAFEANDYQSCIKDLEAHGIEPLAYVNGLDKIIDSLPEESELRKRSIKALSKACGLCGILPISYLVTSALEKPGMRAHTYNTNTSLWKLTDEEHRDQVFAVKSFTVYEDEDVRRVCKVFYRKTVVCKRTKHPNILSIEGVAPKLFDFCMVSQWMVNGNMLDYVTNHPRVNRLELLVGVVRGLDYLHNNQIVHRNLKSSNILIDAEGRPRLSDFGLWSITGNISACSTPVHGDYATRYFAPEVLHDRDRTYKADIYSLSMVIVELVTGKIPYPELRDAQVIIKVFKGERPPKPPSFEAPGMSPGVWKIAKKCWHKNGKKRPDTKAILQSLEKLPKPGAKLQQVSPPQSLENDGNPVAAGNNYQQLSLPTSPASPSNPNTKHQKPSLFQRWKRAFDR